MKAIGIARDREPVAGDVNTGVGVVRQNVINNGITDVTVAPEVVRVYRPVIAHVPSVKLVTVDGTVTNTAGLSAGVEDVVDASVAPFNEST